MSTPLLVPPMIVAQTVPSPAAAAAPRDKSKREFTLKVNKIVFGPTDTSFTILACTDPDTNEKVIVKGTVYTVTEGGTLSFVGEWVTDKRYGEQLQIVSVAPSSDMSIKAFLTSGMIDGISPALGEAIYAKFGEDSANVVEKTPERLLKIARVTDDRLEKIKSSWKKLYSSRDAVALFTSAGMTAKMLKKVESRWLSLSCALEAVKGNPFILSILLSSVPFAVSDRIAEFLGYPADSVQRLGAAMLVALRRNERNGHCYMHYNRMYEEALALTGVEHGNGMAGALTYLLDEGHVKQKFEEPGYHHVYRARTYYAEKAIAQKLQALIKNYTHAPAGLSAKIQEVTFPKPDGSRYQLDTVQAQTVQMACEWGVSVITGGPGTGKTTVLRALLHAFRSEAMCGRTYPKESIFLCAPTGKAARRMSESTGWPASTIHRLLGLIGDDEDDTYSDSNPLDAQVVIVDEASMIDVFLMARLVTALPEGCKFVVVGDVDQLPSIGPGSVFKDIINSATLPIARLARVYRQSEGSRIFDNARAVITGMGSEFQYSGDDFVFTFTDRGENSEQDNVLRAVKQALAGDLTIFDVLVLSPMYKGDVGVTALNSELQAMCNGFSNVVHSTQSTTYKEHDKVLQTVNDYDKMVYNGDVGRIIPLHEFFTRFFDETKEKMEEQHPVYQRLHPLIQKDRLILIDYSYDHIVPYTPQELQESVTLAYAMTVHKAQGSEAHTVIQVLSLSQSIMLYRQLVYTAMTRARTLLHMVGTDGAVRRAMTNVGNTVRNTSLQWLMKIPSA